MRRARIVDDGRCPRWLAVFVWPFGLGLPRVRQPRGFRTFAVAIACGMVVMGVLMWREWRDFDAQWRQITTEMRAGDRGPTR